MGAPPDSDRRCDWLWPALAALITAAVLLSMGCGTLEPIVLPPDPGPVVVIDPPTPTPEPDREAEPTAIGYALVEQVVPGMTEADLIALLGNPDVSSDTTRLWRNAQNRDGKERELRVDVQDGIVTGRSLWRTRK